MFLQTWTWYWPLIFHQPDKTQRQFHKILIPGQRLSNLLQDPQSQVYIRGHDSITNNHKLYLIHKRTWIRVLYKCLRVGPHGEQLFTRGAKHSKTHIMTLLSSANIWCAKPWILPVLFDNFCLFKYEFSFFVFLWLLERSLILPAQHLPAIITVDISNCV